MTLWEGVAKCVYIYIYIRACSGLVLERCQNGQS